MAMTGIASGDFKKMQRPVHLLQFRKTPIWIHRVTDGNVGADQKYLDHPVLGLKYRLMHA
jgi:hypothetical protein